MRLLPTAAAVNDELIRLIRACTTCRIAVAWASVGFAACDLLVKHGRKVAQAVVGTHFYQTHPDFIHAFLSHPGVRFVLNPDGVFHPKLYLFEVPGGGWECVVGSANFTRAAVSSNDEIAVLVTDRDDGGREARAAAEAAIEGYWRRATAIGPQELAAYRDAWQRKQSALRSVRGQFGDPLRDDGDDGRATLDVPLLRMAWPEFYEKVRTEVVRSGHGHSMGG